jgi:uncharacterized tellurite resistance protein B-like protein
MLNAIRTFFENRMAPRAESDAGDRSERVRIAACALLLELAHADNEFSEAERGHVESALVRHFGVPADAVQDLITLAAKGREDAVDLFGFTRLISEHYDLGQRMLLAELMWGVVLADGQIAEHESYLMRKISYLLDLAPAYLAQARQAAESRAGA